MRGLPNDFWAKLAWEDDRVVGYHPVTDHCADVAACAVVLLLESILGRRLAALGGQEVLHPVQVARLGVMAALHDGGKVNLGFQNRAFGRPPFAGHLGEIVNLLFADQGHPEGDRLFHALCIEEMADWTSDAGLADLLLATFSHHGRPVQPDARDQAHLWRPDGRIDPFDGLERLVGLTRTWFPEAWQPGGPPLPDDPPFQHAWTGLLTLADWIGSNSRQEFFPFSQDGDADRMDFARTRARLAVRELGLAPAAFRSTLGTDRLGYRFMGGHFVPRPAQARMLELDGLEGGSVVVLEAATGSGKTEAALAHYLRLFQAGEVDGLYFALPTRTAATQIYNRVCKAVEGAFPDPVHRPATVLAVPGYLSVDGKEGVHLAPFQVAWSDDDGRTAYRGWAAEHSKRYLAGAVAVGTVDQALLSSLTVPHAHLRASSLLRHLLVVDEVHASDVYMTRVLEAVLDHHLAAGGHALLMSATLGAEARVRLTAPPQARRRTQPPPLPEARALPYPALTVARQAGAGPELLPVAGAAATKTVRVELSPALESPGAIAARALHAARGGARTLVIRNTVAGCRDVQVELEALAGDDDRDLLFSCEGLPVPHHARFSRQDRRRLDDAIEAAFGSQRPAGGCVAVATQTVEQSLDLDADLMVTDLAPMDVLLQRIGRLHRHRREDRPAAFGQATVVVLVPAQRDLSRVLTPSGEPRGAQGLGSVYPDLRILEATWSCLEQHAELELPRQNRALVEAATHPDALDAIVATGGEAWQRHRDHLFGSDAADRRLARMNTLDRTAGFQQLKPFPCGDTARRIPTRLGEEDRMVRFDPPPPSPLGPPVEELTLPAYWSRGVPADAERADRVQRDATGFRFRFGRKPFRYDRLGLHQGEATPPETASPTESTND